MTQLLTVLQKYVNNKVCSDLIWCILPAVDVLRWAEPSLVCLCLWKLLVSMFLVFWNNEHVNLSNGVKSGGNKVCSQHVNLFFYF